MFIEVLRHDPSGCTCPYLPSSAHPLHSRRRQDDSSQLIRNSATVRLPASSSNPSPLSPVLRPACPQRLSSSSRRYTCATAACDEIDARDLLLGASCSTAIIFFTGSSSELAAVHPRGYGPTSLQGAVGLPSGV